MVMNKHPIKCHVYIISKLYIYTIQKDFFFCLFNFVTSLYVVSVEILNNTKLARARDS